MHRNFHREIDKLQQTLLTMGSMVEDRVRKACSVIESEDVELAKKIIQSDWEIDEMEIEIEEECLKIMALYQPVAKDLRFLVTVITEAMIATTASSVTTDNWHILAARTSSHASVAHTE